MSHSDPSFDLPAGRALLSEFGIDPAAVREAIEHDRAIRCPDREAAFPERRFADFVPEPPLDPVPHGAAPDVARDPASRARSWRRA